jgi:hypothetical protein
MLGLAGHEAGNGSSTKKSAAHQPGIDAFFQRQKKPAASAEVVKIDIEDDVEVLKVVQSKEGDATPNKRKELEGASASESPEKKTKSF